ncbi:glutathione S-transferase [archaeon]|nr:MAG: glutathione S-transferase [archaeon]
MAETNHEEKPDWTLYYWGIESTGKGRGEYARLMFEVAKVPYLEVNTPNVILPLIDRSGTSGSAPFPAFAVPMITGPRGVCISQTIAICSYLGKRFGLYPDPEQEFQALQIALSIQDFHSDGRACFHPKELYASYFTQTEEAKVAVAKFCEGRLHHWLNHFEHHYVHNNPSGTPGYFVGSRMTYVDIMMYHVLTAAAHQFPEAWNSNTAIPNIKAFRERIEAIPALAEFIKSERYRAFEGNSMM